MIFKEALHMKNRKLMSLVLALAVAFSALYMVCFPASAEPATVPKMIEDFESYAEGDMPSQTGGSAYGTDFDYWSSYLMGWSHAPAGGDVSARLGNSTACAGLTNELPIAAGKQDWSAYADGYLVYYVWEIGTTSPGDVKPEISLTSSYKAQDMVSDGYKYATGGTISDLTFSWRGEVNISATTAGYIIIPLSNYSTIDFSTDSIDKLTIRVDSLTAGTYFYIDNIFLCNSIAYQDTKLVADGYDLSTWAPVGGGTEGGTEGGETGGNIGNPSVKTAPPVMVQDFADRAGAIGGFGNIVYNGFDGPGSGFTTSPLTDGGSAVIVGTSGTSGTWPAAELVTDVYEWDDYSDGLLAFYIKTTGEMTFTVQLKTGTNYKKFNQTKLDANPDTLQFASLADHTLTPIVNDNGYFSLPAGSEGFIVIDLDLYDDFNFAETDYIVFSSSSIKNAFLTLDNFFLCDTFGFVDNTLMANGYSVLDFNNWTALSGGNNDPETGITPENPESGNNPNITDNGNGNEDGPEEPVKTGHTTPLSFAAAVAACALMAMLVVSRKKARA